MHPAIRLVAAGLVGCISTLALAMPCHAQSSQAANPIYAANPDSGSPVIDEVGLQATLAALGSPDAATSRLALYALSQALPDMAREQIEQCTPAIAGCLASQDEGLVDQAISIYMHLTGADAAPVARLLDSGQPRLRAAGAWGLAHMYPDIEEHRDQLVRQLTDADPFAAALAEFALCFSWTTPREPNVAALAPIWDQGSHAQVNELADLVSKYSPEGIAAATRHRRSMVRIAALQHLDCVSQSVAIAIVQERLADPEPDVAAQALSSARYLDDAVLAELMPVVYNYGLNYPSDRLPDAVWYVLAKSSAGCIDAMQLLAAGKEFSFDLWYYYDLADLFSTDVLEGAGPQLQELLLVGDPANVPYVAELLGRLALLKPAEQEWLAGQLASPEAKVRANAARALRQCKGLSTQTTEALRSTALSETDAVAACQMLGALIDTGTKLDSELQAVLLNLLQKDEPLAALDLVGSFEPEQAVAILFDYLPQVQPASQRFLLGMLQKYPLQVSERIAELAPLLDSETYTTVQATAELLAIASPPFAADQLVGLLKRGPYTSQILVVQIFSIHPELTPYACDSLLEMARGSDLALREGALTILGNAGVKAADAVPALRTMAAQEGEDGLARWALGVIEDALENKKERP